MKATYFEVCVNKAHHAIKHCEIDISNSDSDEKLFEQIWNAYKANRGSSILRRLLFQPKNIHFVQVSNCIFHYV